MNKTNPIGVLDYADEGLQYVKIITQRIPNEKIIYFNNRIEGVLDSASLTGLAEEGVDLLIKKNSKAIVVVSLSLGNNTLEHLRNKYKQITFIPFFTPTADVRNIDHNLEGMGVRCTLGAQAKHEFYVDDEITFTNQYEKVIGSKPDYVEKIK